MTLPGLTRCLLGPCSGRLQHPFGWCIRILHAQSGRAHQSSAHMQVVKDYLRLKYAPPHRAGGAALSHHNSSSAAMFASALPTDGLAMTHWASMAPMWQRIIDATSDKWHIRLTTMVS